MLEFLCLFFPAVLGTALIAKLLKNKPAVVSLIFIYAWECLTSNMTVFALKRFLFHTSEAPFSNISVNAAFNYILLATAAAVVIGLFTAFFMKTFELRLEKNEEKREKNDE